MQSKPFQLFMKKAPNYLLSLMSGFIFLSFSGCVEDPQAVLATTKTRAKVGEIVEFLLLEPENYSCFRWDIANSSPPHEIIAGGSGQDVSFRVRFLEPGEASVGVNIRKCASNANINVSDCTCGGGNQRQINKSTLVIIEP